MIPSAQYSSPQLAAEPGVWLELKSKGGGCKKRKNGRGVANQLPALQVNSTPLDAFLIFNLLVFLPLLAIREAVSEDQSPTYVNYLYMHQISVYVSEYKAGIATLTSLLIASAAFRRPVGGERKTSKISIRCN